MFLNFFVMYFIVCRQLCFIVFAYLFLFMLFVSEVSTQFFSDEANCSDDFLVIGQNVYMLLQLLKHSTHNDPDISEKASQRKQYE